MIVKLLNEHHLELLSLKGGYTGSSESIIIKMPHCWKSHIATQLSLGQRSNIVSHRVNTVISSVSKHLAENWTYVLDLNP